MGRGTMDRTVAIIFEKYICINMILKETLGITHLLTKIVRKKDSLIYKCGSITGMWITCLSELKGCCTWVGA